MSARKKICVVTGTRAEYGLLRNLMSEIMRSDLLALQVLVTGAHLSPRYGMTEQEIVEDGFTIDAKVPLDLNDDSPVGIATVLSAAIDGIAHAFGDLDSDLVVLLGDRYEAFGAAQAAMMLGIPVAHLHGGEVTEGAMDEMMRHAITKLAHLHFVTSASYGLRVVQLGEPPSRVFNVGALACDSVAAGPEMPRREIEAALSIDADVPILLVTYHPATRGDADPRICLQELGKALDQFPHHRAVFTGVNADPGNQDLNDAIHEYQTANPARVSVHASLGQSLYLNTMRYCSAVIGNSSSGIIEAPLLRKPTVNIGPRQDGRIRADSVIDCGDTATEIVDAITVALSEWHADICRTCAYPFGAAGAARKIRQQIETAPLADLMRKTFYDQREETYPHFC